MPSGSDLPVTLMMRPHFLRDHLVEQGVRELALAREVERQGLVPQLLAGVALEGPTAARVVDEDVDRAEPLERRLGDALRRALGEEVLHDEDGLGASGLGDLAGHLLQQLGAARGNRNLHALLRKRQRNAAADARCWRP